MENVREPENAVRADVNGCRLLLIFKEEPVEGVFEKIRAVLSSSYDERVLKDLGRILTAIMENPKRFQQRLRNNSPLYKKE